MVNKKKLKKDYLLNVVLLNLAIISGTLFLLNLLPGVVAWMEVQHWGLFLGVFILLMIIPLRKLLFK